MHCIRNAEGQWRTCTNFAQPIGSQRENYPLFKQTRFTFESKPDSIKAALEQKLKDLLNMTRGLKIKAQTKIKILCIYIHAQMLQEIKLHEPTTNLYRADIGRALCSLHQKLALNADQRACQRITSMTRKMASA